MKLKLIKILAISLITITVIQTDNVFAEKKSSIFIHTPLKSTSLNRPGEDLTISFHLSNPNLILLRKHALIVRDGKLFDAPLEDIMTEDKEQSGLGVTIRAPMAELKYQFVLTTTKGETFISPQYAIRRSCIPDITFSNVSSIEKLPVKDQINTLVTQAQELNNDLKLLEQTSKILDTLLIRVKEKNEK